MPQSQLYTRSDGTRFVCDMQRGVYDNQSVSHVKRSLRELEDLQGTEGYVMVSKARDGRIHTALSDVRGFSLGESLWQTLKDRGYKDDANVIWSEQAPADNEGGSEDALLVIIASGQVIYDSRVPPSQLDRNAANLLAQSAESFDVLVYGDTPVKSPDEVQRGVSDLRLNPDYVHSFVILDEPFLPIIKPSKKTELVSIANAFVNAGFTHRWLTPLVLVGLLLAGIGGYKVLTESKPTTVATSLTLIDYYSGYKEALTSPSPTAFLQEMMLTLLALDDIAGKQGAIIQSSTLNSSVLTVHLSIGEGVFMHLSKELKNLGWATQLKDGLLVISKTLSLPARSTPNSIMPLEDVLKSMLDSAFFFGVKVDLEATRSDGKFDMTKMTVHYDDKDYMFTRLLSEAYAPYPTVLESVDFKHLSANEVTANIQLVVYGDRT